MHNSVQHKLLFSTYKLDCVKVSKYGVFSGRYFAVFRLNTGKYEPKKTPYLDTFHVVFLLSLSNQSWISTV